MDESKINLTDRAIDMATASVVEFLTDGKGKVWVNVDGLCMLRIGVVTTQISFTDETGTIVLIPDDSNDLNESLGGADDLDPEMGTVNMASVYAMDESFTGHTDALTPEEESAVPREEDDLHATHQVREMEETGEMYTLVSGRGIAKAGKPIVYLSMDMTELTPAEADEYAREIVDQLNES